MEDSKEKRTIPIRHKGGIMKEVIEEKLKYIGLDLDKIPDFIKDCTALEYYPPRYYEENSYKVYKYVDVKEIQIMLTPTNRLNSIKEKYSQASDLCSYLDQEKEENILRHTTFLKMLKEVQIEEIEKVAKKQQELNRKIPVRVKFEDNYLWQIYYSPNTKKYFMLVTTEDLDYSTFFYLLKKQIECHKAKKSYKIFVPISHMEYSGKYLKKIEFSDIEKYLWVFTKDWPLTYEVYDKTGNLSVMITGTTKVYEKIQSYYRVNLNTKEKAEEFYKLVKALFILQTELPHHYKFITRIGRNGELEFERNNKRIQYEKLAILLKQEAEKQIEEVEKLYQEKEKLSEQLEELKVISMSKEQEYLQKEKQITTYLECRRTFFGRVKYFFTAKASKKNRPLKEEQKPEIKKEQREIQKLDILEKKDNYTIEDLVKICKELDNIFAQVKNLRLDIQASQNKIESMQTKIKNASLYIEEIDSHEKSIFEFWRFANKDENPMLIQGIEEENVVAPKITKAFDYEEDFEDLGIQVDIKQRRLFTNEEKEAIYIVSTEQREVVNHQKEEKEALENLKQEAEQQKTLFQKEDFNIFGGISEDSTKIKLIGTKKHREVARDKFQILNITKDTKVKEYAQEIQKIEKDFYTAFNKMVSQLDMSIYIKAEELQTGIQKAHINPKVLLEKEQEETIYLNKINVKKDSNIVYLSNSIYYDNNNKTLPLGMDITEEVLIDLERYEVTLKEKRSFRVMEEQEGDKVKLKTIELKEYDIEKREEND